MGSPRTEERWVTLKDGTQRSTVPKSSGAQTRTGDLWVMSPTSCLCSTPQRLQMVLYADSQTRQVSENVRHARSARRTLRYFFFAPVFFDFPLAATFFFAAVFPLADFVFRTFFASFVSNIRLIAPR